MQYPRLLHRKPLTIGIIAIFPPVAAFLIVKIVPFVVRIPHERQERPPRKFRIPREGRNARIVGDVVVSTPIQFHAAFQLFHVEVIGHEALDGQRAPDVLAVPAFEPSRGRSGVVPSVEFSRVDVGYQLDVRFVGGTYGEEASLNAHLFFLSVVGYDHVVVLREVGVDGDVGQHLYGGLSARFGRVARRSSIDVGWRRDLGQLDARLLALGGMGREVHDIEQLVHGMSHQRIQIQMNGHRMFGQFVRCQFDQFHIAAASVATNAHFEAGPLRLFDQLGIERFVLRQHLPSREAEGLMAPIRFRRVVVGIFRFESEGVERGTVSRVGMDGVRHDFDAAFQDHGRIVEPVGEFGRAFRDGDGVADRRQRELFRRGDGETEVGCGYRRGFGEVAIPADDADEGEEEGDEDFALDVSVAGIGWMWLGLRGRPR
mmetsp:Transcript_12246/g.26063  ORF Transcript_12246/g.26063 Transcript_12246/m.26063 type:complete len:429 (+) Transcript_12246:681-1967(+)